MATRGDDHRLFLIHVLDDVVAVARQQPGRTPTHEHIDFTVVQLRIERTGGSLDDFDGDVRRFPPQGIHQFRNEGMGDPRNAAESQLDLRLSVPDVQGMQGLGRITHAAQQLMRVGEGHAATVAAREQLPAGDALGILQQ
ncbi:hypothetical protein C7R54_00265 [Achromobacter aloeverae]|uniref:Uncharacterized protein n=1 Tax=Achromobacter aloeverae TaxID=1750518 RepID=A0A4V1MSJ3_9BURK|nr:hypothetical protein C7R54_00265 [Achromobacter aloeverae]